MWKQPWEGVFFSRLERVFESPILSLPDLSPLQFVLGFSCIFPVN